MHEGADLFAAEEGGEVAALVHVEDDDGHVAVGAEGVGGLVHDLEALGDGLVEGEFVVFDGGGVFFRVGGVDAVDAGAFQQGVRTDLEGAEGGAGVGGEERVAGAAGDEGDAAPLEHLHRVVPHVVLRDGFHGRSRKDLRINAFVLDEHREGEGVDDSGEHAHLVAVHAVEPLPDPLQAAEDVAAAIDDGDLEAGLCGGRDFLCVSGQAFRVQ